MKFDFRWNEWNIEHIATHGITPDVAEYAVAHAHRPYPRFVGDGRFIVRGNAPDGTFLQVVYIFSPADVIYVIYARPLTYTEKRRYRRGKC